eukprot:g1696.t1
MSGVRKAAGQDKFLTEDQKQFVRAAVLSLSDISANRSKYSRPCNFDIPQVGEPCFHMNGTVQIGDGKQDAVSPRIWAEAITLASLCCCALWSTDMRGSKPNICRCASGALIIVAAILVTVGEMRLSLTSPWRVFYDIVAMVCASSALRVMFFSVSDEGGMAKGSLQDFARYFPSRCSAAAAVVLDLFDPTSAFHILYICGNELIEIIMQMATLFSRASQADAAIVIRHTVLISCNIVMLPTLMGTAMFKEEWLFLALVVELLIDEAYVIHSLLSTPPTTVLGHTAFLLPIIFSIYSVRTFETIRKRKIPVVVDNIWRVVGYAAVMASALLGYVVISFEVQEGICVAELGDIARCSWPKVYWPQGIFS